MPLAIQILDGTPLRPDGKVPMTVSKAKFEQKGKKTRLLCLMLKFIEGIESVGASAFSCVIKVYADLFNCLIFHVFVFYLPGDKFITKQVDKNKKKKLQKVEQKMLGWGRLSDT